MRPLLTSALLLPLTAAAWRVCDPLAHGASGTGRSYDTTAVRAAAAECGTAGGGTLLFAAGHIFLSGSFNVSSNTEVRVEGTLLGSPNGTDRVLQDFLPWYGPDPPQSLLPSAAAAADTREWSPLLQSWYQSNITICGGGTIDGNGAGFWSCASNVTAPPCSGFPRPHGIRLVGGTGFHIHHVNIVDSPMWQLHLAFTSSVHVHDVNITAPASAAHNSDGIDPDCAQDVLIERVYISTGDDNIAIKSGRNWYGRTFGRPSRNITVRDSVFGAGHGLSIGSEMSGGVYDVLFQNITARGITTGVRIKSERGRGGTVSNITYRDITLENCGQAIQLTDNYDPGIPPTNATATPTLMGITIENVAAVNCAVGWDFEGLPEAPIQGECDTDSRGYTPQ